MIKNPNPVVRSMQNDISGYIRFTLVGAHVSEAMAMVRKRFPLRVDLVRDFLNWLDTSNAVYIEHNHNQLQQWPDHHFDEHNFIVDRTSGTPNAVTDKLVRLMQFSSSSYNTGTADDATTGASTSIPHPRTPIANDHVPSSSPNPSSMAAESANDEVEEISHHNMILQTDTPTQRSVSSDTRPVTDVIAFQSNTLFNTRGINSLLYALW